MKRIHKQCVECEKLRKSIRRKCNFGKRWRLWWIAQNKVIIAKVRKQVT